MITLREIYQALSQLDCAVTRGWPQAMIPLPAIAFSGCEDSVGEDGSRRFQVELKARAASPEGADALAAGADGILSSLGLRRTYMKDGAEKDSDTFTKTLRYEMRESPGTGETLELTAGGQTFAAIPILRRAKRTMLDLRTLDDAHARPHPGPAEAERLSLRLPTGAQGAVTAAFRAGETVTVGHEPALIEGYELDAGGIKLDVFLRGEEG